MGRGLPTARFRLASILLTLLILIVGGVSASDTVPITGTASSTTPQTVYGVQIDPDDVLLQVAIQLDGTGEWQVEYRIRLDDENTTEAFERHREQIESDPDTYRERFATDMRATINNAENTTGRDMSLRNVTVDVTRERIPQRYGVIIYTFDWVGFAATNDSEIAAGDALEGIFLDSETTLIVTWPSEYHRASVSPPPHDVRERGVVWSGSLHFAANEPHLVVSQQAPASTTTTTGPRGDETETQETAVTSPGEGREDGVQEGDESSGRGGRALTIPLLIGLVAIILLVLLGATYGGFLEIPVGESADNPEDGVDPTSDLLSNEEQVQALLEERGGRLKQQEVAEELDWTDAKTSKVIRQMRDDDTIETFRLGRENVVTLPDTDLEDNDI